jgi:hypothetical protein
VVQELFVRILRIDQERAGEIEHRYRNIRRASESANWTPALRDDGQPIKGVQIVECDGRPTLARISFWTRLDQTWPLVEDQRRRIEAEIVESMQDVEESIPNLFGTDWYVAYGPKVEQYGPWHYVNIGAIGIVPS